MPDEGTQQTGGEPQQNDSQSQAGQGAGGDGQQQQEGVTFETWIATQPEAIQTLYQQDIRGLRTALQSEREQRGSLERQLREVTDQLDKGSKAREQLEAITAELESERTRADFFEEAARAGVADLRLAWLAVQDNRDELLDKKGNVNFEKLRGTHPSLFDPKKAAPVPPGHAGSGAGQSGGPPQKDMNAFIRRSAGREP